MEQAFVLADQPAATTALDGPAYGEGRRVRQSSCPGAYGHVRLRIEALDGPPSLLIWAVDEEEIPRYFAPAIVAALEAALRAAADRGLALGDLKLSVIGGSWHPVDSHERDFAMAAELALRAALSSRGLGW